MELTDFEKTIIELLRDIQKEYRQGDIIYAYTILKFMISAIVEDLEKIQNKIN